MGKFFKDAWYKIRHPRGIDMGSYWWGIAAGGAVMFVLNAFEAPIPFRAGWIILPAIISLVMGVRDLRRRERAQQVRVR